MLIQDCRRRVAWTAAVAFLAASAVSAQQRMLTIDDIYDPATRVNFSGTSTGEMAWIDGSHYAMARPSGSGVAWMSIDSANGNERAIFDADKMSETVAKLPGVSESDARRVARSRSLVFDPKYSTALFSIESDLYLYFFDGGRAVRLTNTPGAEENAAFSPDGARVAFVRKNDLYAVDVSTQRETKLTSDGAAKILNGVLDWVYEEE